MGRQRQTLGTAGLAVCVTTLLATGAAAVGPTVGVRSAGAATAPGSATAMAAASRRSAKAQVQLATVPGVGSVLVNSAGQTLYLFEPDKRKKPTCTGACASAWPPLTVVGRAAAGTGVTKKLLGTVKDADGQRQVTYNHWPLYTYVADTAAGQARGEGVRAFGGTWWAVNVAGKKATEQAASASRSSGPTSLSGSGGYGGY